MIDVREKLSRRPLLRAPVGLVVLVAAGAASPAALGADWQLSPRLARPAVAATTRFRGPSSARVGGFVSFSAVRLRAGTYTMRLVKSVIPDHNGVVGTACSAGIGVPTRTVSDHVRISGRLPARLACSSGAGPVEGHYTTRAGKYLITISRDERGAPFGADPFLRRNLRLTS